MIRTFPSHKVGKFKHGRMPCQHQRITDEVKLSTINVCWRKLWPEHMIFDKTDDLSTSLSEIVTIDWKIESFKG